MGLFDKLKKDLFDMAKKAVAEAIEEKLNVNDTDACPAPATKDPDTYFTQIFSSEFPQYSVRRNVRFDTGRADAVPVTYLICKESDPVLAVIVCDKHLYGRKRLSVTIDGCQAQGIPAQCYYSQFRNDRDYVIGRLGQVL